MATVAKQHAHPSNQDIFACVIGDAKWMASMPHIAKHDNVIIQKGLDHTFEPN